MISCLKVRNAIHKMLIDCIWIKNSLAEDIVSYWKPAILMSVYFILLHNHCCSTGICHPYKFCYNVSFMYHFMYFYMLYSHWLCQLPQTASYWIIEYHYVIHICHLVEWAVWKSYLLNLPSYVLNPIYNKWTLMVPQRCNWWKNKKWNK